MAKIINIVQYQRDFEQIAGNSIEGLKMNVHQDKNWRYDFENLACGEITRVDSGSNYRRNGDNGDVIPYPDDFMDDELSLYMKAIGPILRKRYLSHIVYNNLYNKLKPHYSDNEIEKLDFSIFNTFDTIVNSDTYSEFLPWCAELPSLKQIRNECSFKGYRIIDDSEGHIIVRNGDVEFKIIDNGTSSREDGYEVLCRRYNSDDLDSQTYLHCSAPDFARFMDYITESSNNLLTIVRENFEAVSQAILILIDS